MRGRSRNIIVVGRLYGGLKLDVSESFLRSLTLYDRPRDNKDVYLNNKLSCYNLVFIKTAATNKEGVKRL